MNSTDRILGPDGVNGPDGAAGDDRPVEELSYEEAKEQLVAIVATLESGSASLEESMRLWERGEALAGHCTKWLDEAQAAVERGGTDG